MAPTKISQVQVIQVWTEISWEHSWNQCELTDASVSAGSSKNVEVSVFAGQFPTTTRDSKIANGGTDIDFQVIGR
ncbi:hypothetical protein KCU81_g716, partial [Aureobasidium melanogenum]